MGECADERLADKQVHVLRHDHIAGRNTTIPPPGALHGRLKEILALRR
jgi:hypothetical protein